MAEVVKRRYIKMNLSRLKNIFLNILIVLSIIFIARNIYKFWPLIVNVKIKINLLYFAAISFLIISQHFFYVFVWKKLLNYLAVNFSYSELLKLHFFTIVTKYIPGQIWFPLARGKYIIDRGVSVRRTSFIILLDLSLGLGAALLLIIGCFFIYKWNNSLTVYPPAIVIGLAYIFKDKRKQYIKSLSSFKEKAIIFMKTIFKFFHYYLALALFDGIIFYLFFNLFVSVEFQKIPVFIGLNSILRIIFSILPNQLGIGETVQLFLLKYFLVAPYFILIPLLIRCWKVAIDLLLFSVILTYKKPQYLAKEVK
ncbi:MAG: hypothetical protein PHC29_05995 [Candidatus Omnitrophica bacterium]|nr:hypothetical protein [Candidatus Omnitrophota bacterium]